MELLQDSDPRFVGAYRLAGRLAAGGMGIVYLATSPGGRKVVVKLIRPELAAKPEFRARFRHEVAAARMVGGFHTAAVVDADPEASPPWMVTDYIDGPSLEAKVRAGGPLESAAVLALAAALAEGLQAIHTRGLVHRDLKPANIIMADGGPRIIDFGIAKPADSEQTAVTAPGNVVGTTTYMSPEQVEGATVGPASDIFSLGSVLVYAGTGHAPFAGPNFTAVSYAIVNTDPDLRALTGPLRDVVAACLRKDPADRPTPTDLLSSIDRTPLPDSSPGTLLVTPEASPGTGEATVPRIPPSPVAPNAAHTPSGRLPLVRRVPAQQARGPVRIEPQLQVRPAREEWRVLAASADGRWLASADWDGTITAWDAYTARPVRSWPAGTRVRAMAAHAGNLLIAAGDDERVRAWDVESGEMIDYLPTHVPGLAGRNATVRALAVDPTGAWLAASVNGEILIWDVADPREPLPVAGLPGPAEVTALAFDDAGQRLAAGDTMGAACAWDLSADAPPSPLPGQRSGAVLAIAWDDVGRRWITVDSHGGDLRAAALSPAGGYQAVIGEAKRRIHLSRLDAPAQLHTLAGNDLVVTGVGFAGPGVLAVGDSAGGLRLWDTRRPAMRVITAEGSPITALAADPKGTWLAACDQRGRMTRWDVRAVPFARKWSGTGVDNVAAMALSADGALLVTGGDAVRAWDAEQGTPARILPGRAGRARAVAWDQAGKRMAAARADGVVSVWDGRRLLWELPGHKGDALSVAFGPRPGELVSAGYDETIRVWDLRTGRELACLPEQGYRATVLAVSPRPGTGAAGATLAIGCADGTVRVLGPAGLDDATVLAGHVHGITAMSFDASGRWLATASRDGTARIWDLTTRLPTTVLVPGPGEWAAAIASPGSSASGDASWRGLGATDGLIWQAAGLARHPLQAP